MELIPKGHKLSSLNVNAADNGYVVNHSTRSEKPSKSDGPCCGSNYKDHTRVFEGVDGAVRHIGNVLRASGGKRDLGKRTSSRGGSR